MRAPRILVVEADTRARRTVAEALESDGFEVTQASRTDDALPALHAGCPPAVILLDVPASSAVDERIRLLMREQLGAWDVPVVAMSASDQCMTQGKWNWNHWLRKPVDMDALRALLGRLCCPATSDALMFGLRGMDVEHALQFRLADALVQAQVPGGDPRQGSTILHELAEVARGHFAYEEELMRRYVYGRNEEHEREHADWLREVGELQEPSLGASLAVRISMAAHILTMDADLARHLPRDAG